MAISLQKKLIAIALTASMLTACTEPDGSPGRGVENGGAVSKADVGVVVGVVGGGLIGSAIGAGTGQVLAVIGGGLLGGALGGAIGHSMDKADRAAYDHASQQAMESGQVRAWRNDESGHYGTITPLKHYRNEEGRNCREYTQSITIEGHAHTGHGTACKQADGNWRVE